jgi:hypothetical protein
MLTKDSAFSLRSYFLTLYLMEPITSLMTGDTMENVLVDGFNRLPDNTGELNIKTDNGEEYSYTVYGTDAVLDVMETEKSGAVVHCDLKKSEQAGVTLLTVTSATARA